MLHISILVVKIVDHRTINVLDCCRRRGVVFSKNCGDLSRHNASVTSVRPLLCRRWPWRARWFRVVSIVQSIIETKISPQYLQLTFEVRNFFNCNRQSCLIFGHVDDRELLTFSRVVNTIFQQTNQFNFIRWWSYLLSPFFECFCIIVSTKWKKQDW